MDETAGVAGLAEEDDTAGSGLTTGPVDEDRAEPVDDDWAEGADGTEEDDRAVGALAAEDEDDDGRATPVEEARHMIPNRWHIASAIGSPNIRGAGAGTEGVA